MWLRRFRVANHARSVVESCAGGDQPGPDGTGLPEALGGDSVRVVVEGKKMGPIAVLFAIFVLSFVAGIGWYAGRGVVLFVAGIVGRDRAESTARQVQPNQSEKKTLAVFE